MATRADIRAYARLSSDQDGGQFPPDAQYNTLIDAAAKKVWYALWGAGYPANFVSTQITATNSPFYPLTGSTVPPTAEVAGLHGVYFLQGADFYPLHRLNEGKRAALRSSSYMPSGFSGFYDARVDPVAGPGVEFLPKPASGTYQVDYVQAFPGFGGDAAVWYGPGRSDEVIALLAAAQAMRKEGRHQAGQEAAAEAKEVLEQVMRQASWFDLRNAATVRDVNSEQGRYAFDYPLAGPDPIGY